MKLRSFKVITVTLLVFLTSVGYAHPTGNIITVGDHVLWPYIEPVDGVPHKACIMIWKKGAEPKVFMQSEFAASDYMLSYNLDDIYIIERKYTQATNSFAVRVLKATVNDKPKVIWDWFKDEYRIGEGGFFMLSDHHMVFGSYPKIFTLKKGEKPEAYFNTNLPIKKIRKVENNQILLLGDTICQLVQQDGTILKQWDELIDNEVKNAPLNRNQIFDADYHKGALLLSYWGKRSFDLIDPDGKPQTLRQQSQPLVPHWVAFLGHEKLLFSSEMHFDGTPPKPHFIRLNNENKVRVIWHIQ